MELNYNRVELRGTVDDVPALSHVNHGCAFYRFTLSVLRLSGQADKLPVIVPKSLLLLTPLTPGDTVHITGQLADYLPCIAWGAVAQQTALLHTGQRLTVEGRVQSRIYSKTEDGVTSDRTAYEVSVMRPAEREEFPE